MKNILKISETLAKKEYAKHDKNHQWNHAQDVMKVALKLAEHYPKTDLEILKLAVIFHDIVYKKYETHVDQSVKAAEKLLSQNNYPKERLKKVINVIFAHSGPHRRKFGEAKMIEGKIIYDADKYRLTLNPNLYEKYYPQLYLKETRQLIDKKIKCNPLLEKVRKFVVDAHGDRSPHLIRTLYLVKKIKPDADLALQIAALAHDLERPFCSKKISHNIKQKYLNALKKLKKSKI